MRICIEVMHVDGKDYQWKIYGFPKLEKRIKNYLHANNAKNNI